MTDAMHQKIDLLTAEICETFGIKTYQLFAPGQDRTYRYMLFYWLRKKHSYIPVSFIAEHLGVPTHMVYTGVGMINRQLSHDRMRMNAGILAEEKEAA